MSLLFSSDARFLLDVRKSELWVFDPQANGKSIKLDGNFVGLSVDETQVIMRSADGRYSIHNLTDGQPIDVIHAANFAPHQRLIRDPNYASNQRTAHFVDAFDAQVHVPLYIPDQNPQVSQGFETYKENLRAPGQPFVVLMTWYDTGMFEGSVLRCYDLMSGDQCFEAVINGNTEPAIFFSKAQNILIVKEFDWLLFFDVNTFQHMGDLDYLSSATRGIRIEGNRQIAVDVKTGKQVPHHHVQSVSLSPVSKSRFALAVGHEIHHVMVDWNAHNEGRYRSKSWKTEKIVPMKFEIDTLTFHPDGKRIVVRLVDGEVLIQDVDSQRIRTIHPITKGKWLKLLNR